MVELAKGPGRALNRGGLESVFRDFVIAGRDDEKVVKGG